MADLVPSDRIESIVGVDRHRTRHYARAVSADRKVYVLHSHDCLASGIDLRRCQFSLALDRGIDASRWIKDTPLHVVVERGRLVPDAAPVTEGGTDA